MLADGILSLFGLSSVAAGLSSGLTRFTRAGYLK
jgi:hypothetical protein